MLASTVPMVVTATVPSLNQMLVQTCSGVAAGLLVGLVAVLLRHLLFQVLTHQPGRGGRPRADAGP